MNTATEKTIKSIADGATNRRDFLERFIEHTIEEFNVVGGMFWDCTESSPKPICQKYRGEREMLKLGCSAKQHQDLLNQACSSNAPVLIASEPNKLSPSNDPPPSIFLAGVIHSGRKEVIELFFLPEEPRDSIAAKTSELLKLCQAAATYGMPSNPIRNHEPEAAASAAQEVDVTTIEAFIHSLHQSLDLKDNARIIANETRRFLDCDRVTVLRSKGSRSQTLSVSGQPSVNRRSNAIRFLEKVSNKVLPTKQSFWHPSEDAVPPQVDAPLQEYLANSSTRTLVVVPVFDRADNTVVRVDSHEEPKRLIGGIVIEHCRQQWCPTEKSSVVELATRHASDAYRNAWNHQSLFLYGIWKWIGKSKIVFAARHLPKTLAAVAGLVALSLALTFVQSSFQLSCDGTLIPQQREFVFPNRPGVVSDVLVDHGQNVSRNDAILKMTDLDLNFQIAEAEGRIKELQQSIRSAESNRLSQRRDEEESLRQENLKAQIAELESLEEQMKILQQRNDALVVTSPLSGQVMTWEVRKRLQNRPVSLTDQLMEIANVDGRWALELDLPDRKVGHFMKRWKEASSNGEDVNVDFILAAEPGVTHVGRIQSVGTTTELNAENEHHLKILVDIDIDGIELRQSRSGVTAKIDCGKASLGYVWLHPVKEFFQAKVLFPLW